MHIYIPEYKDRFDPTETLAAAGWPSVVQVGPLDGSGRVAVQLWKADAAYKPGADPLGSEEFIPGNGLPSLEDMMADPGFAVAWTVVGHRLLAWAAERFDGAKVETTEQEAAILAAFGQFLASLKA